MYLILILVLREKMLFNSLINKIIFNNKDDYYNFCIILKNFYDVIAISTDDLEPSKLLPYNIILEENTTPIKQKVYKISQVQSNTIKDELHKLLEKKII